MQIKYIMAVHSPLCTAILNHFIISCQSRDQDESIDQNPSSLLGCIGTKGHTSYVYTYIQAKNITPIQSSQKTEPRGA